MSNLTFRFNANSYQDIHREACIRRGTGTAKLCHNTRVECDRLSARVLYHENRIATFLPFGDMLYIPKWGEFGEGRSAFAVTATLSTAGWDSATTALRLHRLIPGYAPVGLSIGITDGQTVARLDGYEAPFTELHFTPAGEVVAYQPSGRPLRVA